MHISKYKIIGLCSLLFLQPYAHADLTISPVQLYITGDRGERSTTSTLNTLGEKSDRTYELSVYRWTQDEQGNDILTPDTELVVNPKALIIKPDSKKVIRFGFRQALNTMNLKQEETWRVKFNEIPSPLQKTGMNIALNFSVPIFVGSGFKSDVTFRFAKDAENHTTLIAKNSGTAHFQITKFSLQDATGKKLTEVDMMKYILPNHQVTIPLKGYTHASGQAVKFVMEKETQKNPVVFDIAE